MHDVTVKETFGKLKLLTHLSQTIIKWKITVLSLTPYIKSSKHSSQ